MSPRDLRICVLGLGYIGLPTASLLATKGYRVHGVDVAQRIVDAIRTGDIHLVEPDLDILVRSAVHSGLLEAGLEPVEADVFVIAVPTPHDAAMAPVLDHVWAASDALAPFLREGNLVLLESTSPVGTTEAIAERLERARPDLGAGEARRFHVAHCPERVLPGQILRELVDNDRVVGGVDPASTEAAAAFYRRFVNGEVIETNARTAELTKLVENSFRDVNIAFANELSVVAHRLGGINVWELIRLANRHPRVNILRPGPGVGGHCLAVDPWFIVHSAPEEARLIRTAREVNDAKIAWTLDRVVERAERFRAPVIGCLGIAYKPDVDDLRESPALWIARALHARFGDACLVCEPNVREVEGLRLASLDEVLRTADVIVALVAHRPFRHIDPELLKTRVLVDACGLFP